MNISLRQLRVFLAVARQQHFRRAAESLHLSQPAVSRYIADLEEELGVRLFDRTTREVVPTEPEARDAFEVRRRAGAVREALDRLRPSEREALVLRYVADLNHREIAGALDLDEATARKRVSRALSRLRADLVEE